MSAFSSGIAGQKYSQDYHNCEVGSCLFPSLMVEKLLFYGVVTILTVKSAQQAQLRTGVIGRASRALLPAILGPACA